MREVFFEDVAVGMEMPTLVKGPIIKLHNIIYAGASGDFNPLHTDDDFARAVGMKDGMITHGMLIMGFVGHAVTNFIPKKYLKRFGVRFAGMTRPGNTITITGSVVEKKSAGGSNLITCEVTAVDETGDVKITGSFDAALPSRG